MQECRSADKLAKDPSDHDLAGASQCLIVLSRHIGGPADQIAPFRILDHIKQLATVHPLQRQTVVARRFEIVDERYDGGMR